jgi:hypothetical protein
MPSQPLAASDHVPSCISQVAATTVSDAQIEVGGLRERSLQHVRGDRRIESKMASDISAFD